MVKEFFNIRYEFEPAEVRSAIDRRLDKAGADYICVADGVILNTANRVPEYLEVVNSGMFSICDSSYVPMYIKMIYGESYNQYCGSQIFRDLVGSRAYRMIFLGTQQPVLDSLRENIAAWNPDVLDMKFVELPFCTVDEFDYRSIAEMVDSDGADIIWVALGAPKQEYFMHRLKPHLKRGVMIAVGAAFKFYSGESEKRAPEWMIHAHLEFLFRIMQEPRKQLARCKGIVTYLPKMFFREIRTKHRRQNRKQTEL